MFKCGIEYIHCIHCQSPELYTIIHTMPAAVVLFCHILSLLVLERHISGIFWFFLGGGSGLFNKVQPYCRIHTSEFVPLKRWLISFVHFIYVFIQGWLCFHRLDLFWCWEHWLADTHFFSFWHMYILEGFYHSTYFSSLAAPALWMSSCTLLNA